MTKMFSKNREVTVYKSEQPDLYELAAEALFNGDGTFSYKGRLWEANEGDPEVYLLIRPEVPNG